jgi:hypothetical protein
MRSAGAIAERLETGCGVGRAFIAFLSTFLFLVGGSFNRAVDARPTPLAWVTETQDISYSKGALGDERLLETLWRLAEGADASDTAIQGSAKIHWPVDAPFHAAKPPAGPALLRSPGAAQARGPPAF